MKKIQKNAKYLAPVKDGDLRNSIKEDGEIEGNEIHCKVYTNCDHAIYPEFRNSVNVVQKAIWIDQSGVSYKADWKGQTAQPYMTPAYLQAKNTGEVEQEVVKSVQQDIRKMESGK